MKYQQIYDKLKEFAGQLDVSVCEHNFRTSGIKVKSGFCNLKGKRIFVMDKHESVKNKSHILGSWLCSMEQENVSPVS